MGRWCFAGEADAADHGLSPIVDAGGEVTGLGSGTGACHESQKSVGSQTGVVIEPPTEIGTLSFVTAYCERVFTMEKVL